MASEVVCLLVLAAGLGTCTGWPLLLLLFSTHCYTACLVACSVVDELIVRYTRGTCVLDGELLVWNKTRWVRSSVQPSCQRGVGMQQQESLVC